LSLSRQVWCALTGTYVLERERHKIFSNHLAALKKAARASKIYIRKKPLKKDSLGR
jgi:hypothetical protein